MKTLFKYYSFTTFSRVGLVAAAILTAACSSDSDMGDKMGSGVKSSSMYSSSSSSSQKIGFEAVLSDFVSYKDWTVVDYAVGASNPLIGGAHGGGADSSTRKTYMNTIAENSDGAFEKGSILVKEVFTYNLGDNGMEKTFLSSGGLVAMVKRGEGFNPDNNGWEWFMLEPDLSAVAVQGADLSCNGCHAKAATQDGGMDYVFPKPTEVVVANDAFSDYTSWDLIGFDTAPSNLGGGAHVNDSELRRTYQKQLLANPSESGDHGYPVGTMLVKDITKDGEIQQVVAMIKRGGTFDVANGNWEYFMLDPSDASKVVNNDGVDVRGAIAGCIGCHTKAKGDAGIDFVFKHTDAPFNTSTIGEFVVSKEGLMNYADWTITDYALGASNPFIGMAHSGANPEYARAVFQNAVAGSLDGDEYPVGSILVKETFTTESGKKVHADAGGVLAMVKRGGTYNPDNNGWEWIMMSAEGGMLARGADLMGGACNACHSKAADTVGTDYTFKKPSEKIATLADFADYQSWIKIDEVTGDSAANGGAHTVGGIRKTYKMPASASPNYESGEYPVGTIVVKEIIVGGALDKVYAMVKRGGTYNPEHGGWQWFTLSSDLKTLSDKTGKDAGCKGCHGKAGSAGDDSFMGKDYVFFHKDDPVSTARQ